MTTTLAPVTPAEAGGTVTPGGPPATRGRRRRRRKLTADYVSFMIVFLGLPLALFLVFVIWPFGQAAYYALTDWSGFEAQYNFIGLDNFRDLLDDETFLKAVRNNILLALIVPFVTIVIALTFATMVTIGGSRQGQLRGVRNSSFYRVVSFFPYVIPAIVIGFIWRLVLDPQNGLLNGVLTAAGLDRFEGFAWLGEESTARWVTMFVIVWGFIGFYMVLFIAAIKGVPAEIYDAARIDGAGRLRMTTTVTIPLIRDAVQTAYIYLGILALDAFVYVAALNPTGGPDNSTLVMSQELWRTAFIDSKFGYATAMGVVLAIVTLVFAAIVFTVNRLTGGRQRISVG